MDAELHVRWLASVTFWSILSASVVSSLSLWPDEFVRRPLLLNPHGLEFSSQQIAPDLLDMGLCQRRS
jgi:hypothetical protein